MKLNKLGTLLTSMGQKAAILVATLVIVGATGLPLATPNVDAAQAAPSVQAPMPPAPTKNDKPQTGVQGKKGAPPSSGGVSTLAACSGPCYFYAGGSRSSATPFDGVGSAVRVAKPIKDSVDSHSLAEISAEKVIGGKRQIVEVGWTVDQGVNGDLNPHIFVYRWVNDTPSCYNGCGWVDYAPNPVNAGANISADIGTVKYMSIQYFSGNWWIGYNNNWLGYFPGSIWTNAGVAGFTNMNTAQTFGEIAAHHSPTCSDMGNGIFASTKKNITYPATGADFISLNILNGTSWVVQPYTGTVVSDSSKWNVLLTSSVGTLRYGGPGATTCP
jgi:hypothetical protein